MAALWLQDWVGQRRTSFGSQLWWNWKLDRDHYPDWQGMRERLQDDGVRLMIYFSPFLVEVSEKNENRRNLFREAKDRGYLVKNSGGEPHMQQITSFSAALIDLTNPRARE